MPQAVSIPLRSEVGIGDFEDTIAVWKTRVEFQSGSWTCRDYHLEMPRNTVRRKLQRLIEIGLVECIDHRYYMTVKANAPLQREVLLAHLHNMQAAIKEVSK